MKPAHPEETSGFRSFNLHRPPAEKICTGVTSPRQGDLDVGYPIDVRGQANRLQQFSSRPVRFITTYSSVNSFVRQPDKACIEALVDSEWTHQGLGSGASTSSSIRASGASSSRRQTTRDWEQVQDPVYLGFQAGLLEPREFRSRLGLVRHVEIAAMDVPHEHWCRAVQIIWYFLLIHLCVLRSLGTDALLTDSSRNPA